MLVACSLRYAYELQARRAVETMMRPEERHIALLQLPMTLMT